MTTNSPFEHPDADLAYQLLAETQANLFLTGKAGTGKTTFLRHLRQHLPKRMAVLAPTGIAAIHAGGDTIHSFFQLPFTPYVPTETAIGSNKLRKQKRAVIQALDLIVIDEVSMVRADLLDAVDATLRHVRHSTQPFGGVQVLLIGDLQQLPPVVRPAEWALLRTHYATPYFFSAHVLSAASYQVIELTHVYRQTDDTFLTLLNRVRAGEASVSLLQALNARYQPQVAATPLPTGVVQLVTHNAGAQVINQAALDAIDAPAFTYSAKVTGRFPEQSFPTDADITLKVGSQVLFVKNDSERGYYNGLLGTVIAASSDGFTVQPIQIDAAPIRVQPERWTSQRYVLNPTTGAIEEEVEGTFLQYPIKLAWAITIHKSQGLTFDRVRIDAAAAFAHGQTYVALSRCRTLDGIVLTSPLPAEAIRVDSAVMQFNQSLAERRVTSAALVTMRNAYLVAQLNALFDFSEIQQFLERLHASLLPYYAVLQLADDSSTFEALYASFRSQVIDVAQKFRTIYPAQLPAADRVIPFALQSRFKRAAAYFEAQLQPILDLYQSLHFDHIDAAVPRRRLTTLNGEFLTSLRKHLGLLHHVAAHGYDLSTYAVARQRILMPTDNSTDSSKRRSSKVKQASMTTSSAASVSTTNASSHLATLYYAWRTQKVQESAQEGHPMPPYRYLRSQSIQALCQAPPSTLDDLRSIPGIGPKTIADYGEELLQIALAWKSESKH